MMLQEYLRIGVRCAAAFRVTYWWPGDQPKPEALELAWEDGSAVVFDVKSDWTLTVTDGPWRDPYSGVDTSDPSWDLGTWTKDPIDDSDPGEAAVGSVLTDFVPHFNEVGEFSGLDLVFDAIVLHLEVRGGDLTVQQVGCSATG